MKLRSTTPTSRKLKTRIALFVVAGMLAVTTPLAFARQANANNYDARIAALQRQVDQYNAAARELGAQADTLQRQLDGINNEIAAIQSQIELTQAQYDKVVAEIVVTEKQIADNRDALGEVIADLSVEGKISPLEMIASARNISDYVNKQTYQSAMQDELKTTIDRIKELKAQLDQQKQQTEILLANQKNARAALDAKRAEQQRLVNETRGQEAAYLQLKNKTEAEKKQAQAEQQAAIQAAMRRGGGVSNVGGSSGGYRWNDGNCPMMGMYSTMGADGNGGDGYGYGCRQCASYAAWAIGRHTGTIPTYLGNANNFPSSLSHRPQVRHWETNDLANSVGVIMDGAYGHVVWVESNPDARGNIIVSQYNAITPSTPSYGNFSRVSVHKSTYDVFIKF